MLRNEASQKRFFTSLRFVQNDKSSPCFVQNDKRKKIISFDIPRVYGIKWRFRYRAILQLRLYCLWCNLKL